MSTAEFLPVFDLLYHDASKILGRGADMAADDFTRLIDTDLADKLSEMRRAINEAATFLPAYELRQANARLNEIQENARKLRTEKNSKSKFSFKSRQKSVVVKGTAAQDDAASAAVQPSQLSAPIESSIPTPNMIAGKSPAPILLGRNDLKLENIADRKMEFSEPIAELTLSGIENCESKFRAIVAIFFSSLLFFNEHSFFFCG